MKQDTFFENAMAYALQQGAEACEIYFVSSATHRTAVREMKLSDDNVADTKGFSLRLIKNGVVGFSYGTTIEKESLRSAVDSALLSCEFLPPEPNYTFLSVGQNYGHLPKRIIKEVPFSEKMEILLAMEEAAVGEKHIKKTERCVFSQGNTAVMIKNTLGLDLDFSTAYVSCGVSAVAEQDGETESGGEFMMGKELSDLTPIAVAKTAAENARDRLGAITVDSGEYPVILHQEAVLNLLSVILPSFLGDNIRKGQSKLKDKLGTTFSHPEFCLYDDGLYFDGIGSCPFDDQGTPTQKTSLVKNGIVNAFLYDIAAGAKVGKPSTGNGYTGSTKALPTTGFGNYYLLGGSTPQDKLFSGIEKGIYVKELMGLHMANGVSGDFSLGVRGFLIEQGQKTKSIRGNMMAGNIFSLLKEVEAIGDDFRFYGYRGAPSLKVKSLKISGKT